MGVPTILTETPKLRIEMEVEGSTVTVRPVGTIDEDVNFSVVLNLINEFGPGMQLLQFDLGRVTRLNSCGVREWLLFMEKLGTRVKVAFLSVGERFIEQANMIPNTFGRKGTPVLSFYAPYFCPQCKTESMAILKPSDVKHAGDGSYIPPVVSCRQCNSMMDFDSIISEYFGFLQWI